ncbi:MAG: hypothetical protein IJM21_07875 [Clostridia bacterium]|nr:hypothetical protein [Clostridia bacterium]
MKIPFTGIRRPRDAGSLSRRTLFALLFLLAGAGMGIFAKWLDTLTFDESSWLQRALGRIDPGGLFSGVAVWFLLALIIAVTSPTPFQAGLRVFLFYAGMCVSYQLYSIFVVRFTPAASYMLIWYGLTILSFGIAFAIWYVRGEGAVPVLLSILILGNMAGACFSFGYWQGAWHFAFYDGLPNLILFLASAAVVHKSWKRTLITIPAAFLLALLTSPLTTLLGQYR